MAGWSSCLAMASSWCPVEAQALAACIAIQQRLHATPVYAGGSGSPVQMQMGIECGEVVEIDGDCYGDAVNSAARLADLAGAEQILTTQRVRNALEPAQQAQLRGLGPMYLRGKSEVTDIFRVDWRADRDVDATVMGVSMLAAPQRGAGYFAEARAALGPVRTVDIGPGEKYCSLAINDTGWTECMHWSGAVGNSSSPTPPASEPGSMWATRPSPWCCVAPSVIWWDRATSCWGATGRRKMRR